MKQAAAILFISLATMLAISACAENKNKAPDNTQIVSTPSLREMTLPEGWTLKVIPPEYKTVHEQVVVTEGVEWVTIPPEYKWIDGEIEGYDLHEPLPNRLKKPPVYENVVDIITVQDAYTRLSVIPPLMNDKGSVINPMRVVEEHVPAITKNVTRRVIKTPAEPLDPAEYTKLIESMKTPHLIENGRTRILVKSAQILEREKPVVTKTKTRQMRIQNETYALYHEYGELVAVVKNFDELMAARKIRP